MPDLSLDPSGVRLALIGGIVVGLFVAFFPNIFHRKPPPDLHISRQAERRIIAERTLERIGTGGGPVDTDPNFARHGPAPDLVTGDDDLSEMTAGDTATVYPGPTTAARP